jgi:ribose 1,5-bisphosphokinase PhnN
MRAWNHAHRLHLPLPLDIRRLSSCGAIVVANLSCSAQKETIDADEIPVRITAGTWILAEQLDHVQGKVNRSPGRASIHQSCALPPQSADICCTCTWVG